jgi:hypothetical protein
MQRLAAIAVLAIVPLVSACPTSRDGLDRTKVPTEIAADYDVFAQRCSKCHSLARPLDSGIRDDGWWARYVARMRRMPSSGISEGDSAPILRFLHWYSVDPASPASTISPPPPAALTPLAPLAAPAPSSTGGAQ